MPVNSATPHGRSRVSRSSVLPRNPTLHFERKAWQAGYEVVAGADEVGRGAWAGPMVAGAVVLPQDAGVRRRLTRLLNQSNLVVRDSKQVSPDDRQRIVDILQALSIPTAVSELSPAEVDELGVGAANRTLLYRAITSLERVDYALLDAFSVSDIRCDWQAVKHGDQRCLSIALASIVAKVHRDEIMIYMDESYPGYGFRQHKGYGTRAHADALRTLGACDQHRKSFRPVAEGLVRA